MAENLRLAEFGDIELFHLLLDINGGGATTEDVVSAINLNHSHPERCVISRFQWLKRLGALYRDGNHWVLSDAAKLMVTEALPTKERQALDDLPEEALLEVMRTIGRRYQYASYTHANLIRREWQHTSRRAYSKP